MKPFENDVIIFGNNHHNTLGLIRSLGEVGLRPIALLYGCEKDCLTARSRYIGKLIISKDESSAYKYLIDNYSNRELKPIVFCPNDIISELLDEHYDELKNSFYFQNAGRAKGLVQYYDKEFLCVKAEKWGFVVPKTQSSMKGAHIPDNIEYPCLIKPQKSKEGSKSDIMICKNEEDLISNIYHLSYCCESFLIQQFIDKEIEVSVLGVALHDRVLLPGMIYKTREYPIKKGSSSFAVLTCIIHSRPTISS